MSAKNGIRPQDWVDQVLDPFLYGTMILAILFLAICIYLVWGVHSNKSDQPNLKGFSQRERFNDLFDLWLSINDYIKDHRFVFVVLLAMSSIFYILFAIFALGHPKPSKKWTAEDLFLALSAGIGSALVILVMTDFAAKRFLSKVVERQKDDILKELVNQQNSLADVLAHQHEICAVYRKTGLHVLPSVKNYSPTFKMLFCERHVDCKNIKVMSTSGANWLRFRDNWTNEIDPIQYLINKPIRLQLLIYSPILHYFSNCSQLGIVMNSDEILTSCLKWLEKHEIFLSSDTAITILQNHLVYWKQSQSKVSKNQILNLEIKLSGKVLPSSFFLIDEQFVYSTFPMKVRRHDNAIAIAAYTLSPEFNKSVAVDSFVEEFSEFWNDGIDFTTFMESNSVLIQNLVAANISNGVVV